MPKLISRRRFVILMSAAIGSVMAACATSDTDPVDSLGELILRNVNNPPSKPTWNVRYYRAFKPVDTLAWRLKVEGLVDTPGEFSLADLQAWPRINQVSRMVCVEGWSSKAEWYGFDYAALAAIVHPSSSATYLRFDCADGYYEVLPINETNQPRVLFAYGMDGEPLPALFGSPLRALYPSKYGYKGAKAITSIRFGQEGGRGYWSTVGPYSIDGTIQPGLDRPVDLGGIRTITGGEVTDY